MLGQNIPKNGIVIRSIFRTVRVFSSWRALELFRKAEVSYKNNRLNGLIQVLKAAFYIYFLGHFLACIFYFIVSEIEDGSEPTWIDYNELANENVGV
jgi:ABC-type phosphate/phosphonate transport system permease subunit